MVAFGTISTALAFTAAALPVALAGIQPIDFSDNYVKPGEIRPLYESHGYTFEHFDLIGGLLDTTGHLVYDLLATVGDILGGGGRTRYGHGVGIIGGYDQYKLGRIHHSSGKPFNILGLKTLCCAPHISRRCDPVDCRIKISGYDKPEGGRKVYDHEFYIPKSSHRGRAPVYLDTIHDGIATRGVPGQDLSSILIDIDFLDTVDNGADKRHSGRYSYKSRSQSRNNRDLLGLGLLVDLDLKIDL
ncbi:hypothetical protein TWF106_003538 [Orbilia oligospora]|uniref:Uncharacterized protein n=1 Tax=Orbilia oligospora TaxID=2813651 RepID=A0A6G1LXA3_ORBOL|nr:hypothetical protein TWF106_003538 [Orbilia oligospora]KAF3203654.1 hypothetical protein TWF191_002576 [Orbilia oligospora]KAF3237683.1 hypothetical protein TWF192_010793 [Orbilia oligospora]